MKVQKNEYPYDTVSGVNALTNEIQNAVRGIQWQTSTLEVAAKTHTWFMAQPGGVAFLESDDLAAVTMGTTYLSFTLAVPASTLARDLVKILGVPGAKSRGYDGKLKVDYALNPLHSLTVATGIEEVTLRGYVPESCTLVVKKVPLTDEERKVYEGILAEGKTITETVCPEHDPAPELDVRVAAGV